MGCRLYDKVQEIINTGKAWVVDQWIPKGWKPGESVWRLEFEFKRDFLKARQLRSLEEVLANLNGLWTYATTEWLRLTVPCDGDKTRTRWPTHSLWIDLASVDWESRDSVLLDKCSNASNPTELRLITVVLGALTSYMAMYGIDNRAEAIDGLVSKLYEHYSTIASKGNSPTDTLLTAGAGRVRCP
jgi:hypothetical protein